MKRKYAERELRLAFVSLRSTALELSRVLVLCKRSICVELYEKSSQVSAARTFHSYATSVYVHMYSRPALHRHAHLPRSAIRAAPSKVQPIMKASLPNESSIRFALNRKSLARSSTSPV